MKSGDFRLLWSTFVAKMSGGTFKRSEAWNPTLVYLPVGYFFLTLKLWFSSNFRWNNIWFGRYLGEKGIMVRRLIHKTSLLANSIIYKLIIVYKTYFVWIPICYQIHIHKVQYTVRQLHRFDLCNSHWFLFTMKINLIAQSIWSEIQLKRNWKDFFH